MNPSTMSTKTATNTKTDNSDPISYTCTCPAQKEGGQILLFYRYWTNEPSLPPSHLPKANDPDALARWHKDLATRLNLGGKFRLAKEGFNITLGGTTPCINEYINACLTHWSFANLSLSTPEAQKSYFKPTPGCACAFANQASVRVTAEITPLGLTDYAPRTWSNVVALSPAAFHEVCEKGEMKLVDVRNHYESRVGYFVTGAGEVAVRPAVRRFSQWPGYVARHVLGDEGFRAKPIATYCTGGIRCEKGARWMQERLAAARAEDGRGDGGKEEEGDVPVYTLKGGIVAYQAWMEQEIKEGRKKPEESYFKGKMYVFDARGAIAPDNVGDGGEKVSSCHGCGKIEDALGKCSRVGCNLVLVVCGECEKSGEVTCCEDCRRIGEELQRGGDGEEKGRGGMCKCESERERSLWGDGGAKLGQGKSGKRRGRQKQN